MMDLSIHWASDVMVNFSKSGPMKKQSQLHIEWHEICALGFAL